MKNQQFTFTVNGTLMMLVGKDEASCLLNMITRFRTDFELIDDSPEYHHVIMDNVKMGKPGSLVPATVIHDKGKIIVCSKAPQFIEEESFIRRGLNFTRIDASKKNYYWPMDIVETNGEFVKEQRPENNN